MQRIARTALSDQQADPSSSVSAEGLAGDFDRLQSLLKGRVTGATLSLFAQPQPSAVPNSVDWITQLGGQPLPIASLDGEDVNRVGAILNERLEHVLKVATDLARSAPEDAEFLRRSAMYKGQDSVYVLNGEPVLTEWGAATPDPANAALAPSMAAVAASERQEEEATARQAAQVAAQKARSRHTTRRVLIGLALLLLVLGCAGWWFFIRESFHDKLVARLASADCIDVAEIAALEEIQSPKNEQFELLRAQVDERLAQCALEDLRIRLAEAEGNCPVLQGFTEHELLREPSQPEYVALRSDLDRQLTDCAFDDLSRRLETADCVAVDEILKTEPLLGQDAQGRFLELRVSATAKAADCRYEELEAAVSGAEGQCDPTAQILQNEPLLQEPPEARFSELRGRVDVTLRNCAFAELQNEVQAADCDATAQLLGNDPLLADPEPRFAELREVAEAKIADCSFDDFKQEMETAASDCNLARQVLNDEPRLRIDEPRYLEIKQRLEARLTQCRAQFIEEARNQCPGERPPEFAPQFALVLDASESMGESIPGAGFNSRRMDAARSAASTVLGGLPSDVGSGLVVLDTCQPTNHGYFPPSRRSELIGIINRVRPWKGTALAQGIEEAARLVDGVERDAVIVVVSDGEESCRANPVLFPSYARQVVCDVGQRLAQTKPRLTINVVDIGAVGAANCLARATGGNVYPARNASEVAATTQNAAKDALGPARCRAN